jgi:hypothetical protein
MNNLWIDMDKKVKAKIIKRAIESGCLKEEHWGYLADEKEEGGGEEDDKQSVLVRKR